MKPVDSHLLRPAQNTSAPVLPTSHVAIPASSSSAVSTNSRPVIEGAGGRKRSAAAISGGAASGGREASRRASLHQNFSNPNLEVEQNERQEVGSFEDVNRDVLGTVHRYLSPIDRASFSQTCKRMFEGYSEIQREYAGSLGGLSRGDLQMVDGFLNSKDSKSLSQTCMLAAPLKSIARQFRYPTHGEIGEMIRDPRGKGQMLFGEVKLPSSILDHELTALINQGSLSKVTKLDLSSCTNITNVGLLNLGQCTSLRSLDLSGCTHLTDGALRPLRRLQRLEHLSLRSCTGLGSHTDLLHLDLLPLKSLDVSNCERLTRYGVILTFRGGNRTSFQFLESLNISNSRLFRSEYMDLFPRMPLKVLDISGCRHIGDGGLEFLRQLPLTSLNLSGCDLVTDRGLAFLHQMPLTSLNISGCPHITPAGRASLNEMQIHDLRT